MYTGSLDAGQKIYQKHGLRGIWKGWTATMIRDVSFYGLYFTFYEILCKSMKGDNEKASPLIGFLAGGTTGCISWLLIFPTDSFKSISQTDNLENRKFKNYRDKLVRVVKEKGFNKLYSGLGVCLLRAFPVNAITFAFYEVAKTNIMESIYKN